MYVYKYIQDVQDINKIPGGGQAAAAWYFVYILYIFVHIYLDIFGYILGIYFLYSKEGCPRKTFNTRASTSYCAETLPAATCPALPRSNYVSLLEEARAGQWPVPRGQAGPPSGVLPLSCKLYQCDLN